MPPKRNSSLGESRGGSASPSPSRTPSDIARSSTAIDPIIRQSSPTKTTAPPPQRKSQPVSQTTTKASSSSAPVKGVHRLLDDVPSTSRQAQVSSSSTHQQQQQKQQQQRQHQQQNGQQYQQQQQHTEQSSPPSRTPSWLPWLNWPLPNSPSEHKGSLDPLNPVGPLEPLATSTPKSGNDTKQRSSSTRSLAAATVTSLTPMTLSPSGSRVLSRSPSGQVKPTDQSSQYQNMAIKSSRNTLQFADGLKYEDSEDESSPRTSDRWRGHRDSSWSSLSRSAYRSSRAKSSMFFRRQFLDHARGSGEDDLRTMLTPFIATVLGLMAAGLVIFLMSLTYEYLPPYCIFKLLPTPDYMSLKYH